MRTAIALTVLVALATPTTAAASESDGRPFARGVLLPSVALGGGFTQGYGGRLLVGAGASYFVANGFAVGLHVRNATTFYSQAIKELPFYSQIPTNQLSVTPSVMWVLFRSPRISPYLVGGVGPVFLNRGRGTLGEWHAGPGLLIGTGGPLFIDIGFTIGSRFTRDRCEDAFTFVDPSTQLNDNSFAQYACSFTWGFRGGIVFGFGGTRQRRAQQAPPASTTPPQPQPSYPAPVSAPAPAPEPDPSASPQPSPVQPIDAEPVPASPPATSPSTSPSEGPVATPPPAGESLPVPPPA